MKLKSDELLVFTHLGLTTRQAEVYITLCKFGQATAQECAIELQIARSEIYRTIPFLEKLGLIQRIIDFPTAFKAIPVTEGLSILLRQRSEQYKKLQSEAETYTKTFIQKNPRKSNLKNDKLFLMFRREMVRGDYEKRINCLQKSLDCITIWAHLLRACSHYGEAIERAIERKVKFRYITCRPKGELGSKTLLALMKTGFYDVKFVSVPPPTSLAIFDKRHLGIVVLQKEFSPEITVLSTGNLNLVGTAQDYFDLKWRYAHAKSMTVS